MKRNSTKLSAKIKFDLTKERFAILFIIVRLPYLIEPVRRRSEPSSIEDHPDCEVRIVDVEVEGHAPHHDQARVHVLDLPAHGPAGPGGSAALKKSYLNFIDEFKWKLPRLG